MSPATTSHGDFYQWELFPPDRWPRRPYCSDDKSARSIRSLPDALRRPYIQANPPHLRVWAIFDVDRAGGATAWEDAFLPPPAWASVNRENGHAHLVWGLTVPVLLEAAEARQAPMRYLCAVESAFRARLRADGGYAGLLTKNPAHPKWITLKGPRRDYELGELAEWVDLPKHLPKRKPEEIGLGRNVTLFDWLRHAAYRTVRPFKLEARGLAAWRSFLLDKALSRNGDFVIPLDEREVSHIVRSVAKWTWAKFDLAASDAKFSALQAHRGQLGGKASGASRLAASEDRRASARLMRERGMSVRAIAAELGVSVGSAHAWCSAKP